jgi:hypothetical protein
MSTAGIAPAGHHSTRPALQRSPKPCFEPVQMCAAGTAETSRRCILSGTTGKRVGPNLRKSWFVLAQTSMRVQTLVQTWLLVQTGLRGHLLPGFREGRLKWGVLTHLGRHVRGVLLTLVVWLNMQRWSCFY